MKKIIVNALFVLLALAFVSGSIYTTYYFDSKKNQENILQKENGNETDDEGISSTNIKVFSPKPNETAKLPIVIIGEVRTFENSYAVRLLDKNGKVLTEEYGTALEGEMGQFNLFRHNMNYPKPTTSEGSLEVFQYSAKDGSEIDKVVIPLKFGYTASTNIKAYFGKENLESNMEDCSQVFSVQRRVPPSENLPKLAVEELLKGPTASERDAGYFTSINMGTKIKSLVIKNGTAYIDFDSTLEHQVGGSCMVIFIRSQIIETLKQFSSIKEVVISIDGRTEDILQP